ncbi:hypothetical protein N2152v2_010984 [Parachlorella kessleri]
MSRLYSASQFDNSFRPHMLGNWEVADTHKQQPSNASSPTCKTEDGRTIPIVDKNGHLLVKKRPAAFNKPPVYALSAPRWPQVNPSIKGTAAATMGYKGIQTDYLPSSTVPLKTVELPDCKEHNYH